ncbi:winged helix-turn-helix transcriptional regulator [bacterium]|nr:winged helix-turn-helix transcriptional regulator [bacterium]
MSYLHIVMWRYIEMEVCLKQYLIVTKALADESRVRILKLLQAGELCVCQIQAVIGLGQSTISKHLSILKNAGLVEIRKDGIWIYHRVASRLENDYISVFLDSLSGWLNDDVQIEADRSRLKEILSIDLKDLCKR